MFDSNNFSIDKISMKFLVLSATFRYLFVVIHFSFIAASPNVADAFDIDAMFFPRTFPVFRSEFSCVFDVAFFF